MLCHCSLNFFLTATTMWLLINQKSRLDLWKPRGFYVVPTLLHSQPWNGQELRGLFLILFPLFFAVFPIKFINQKFLKGFYAWPSGIFSVPVDAISNRSKENIQEIIWFLLLQAELDFLVVMTIDQGTMRHQMWYFWGLCSRSYAIDP